MQTEAAAKRALVFDGSDMRVTKKQHFTNLSIICVRQRPTPSTCL